jgi:hypothetical protein
MKKVLIWLGAGLLALIVAFAVVQTLASERVEVVEVVTVDEEGEAVVTRLWIVDHEGRGYLRVGGGSTGWFRRLSANPSIEVERAGLAASYRAVPEVEKREVINRLMQEKYTWGDTFFATVFGSRDGSIPIALHPVSSD